MRCACFVCSQAQLLSTEFCRGSEMPPGPLLTSAAVVHVQVPSGAVRNNYLERHLTLQDLLREAPPEVRAKEQAAQAAAAAQVIALSNRLWPSGAAVQTRRYLHAAHDGSHASKHVTV